MDHAIGKGTVVVYTEQVVNAICSFFISILLARHLGFEDFGLWKLFASITVFVTFSSSFGIEISIIRYISFFLVQNERKNINRLITWALAIRWLFLFVLFTVIYFSRNLLDEAFNTSELFSNLFFLTVTYLLVYHTNTIIGRAVLTGYSQRHVFGMIKILTKILSLVLIVIVVNKNGKFEDILYVLALIQLIELFVYLPIAGVKVFKNVKSHHVNGQFPYKRILKFALPNYFYLSGQVFTDYSIDNFVITHFMTLKHVALYGVSIAFPTYMGNFSPGRVLQGVLIPSLVSKYTKDESKSTLIFIFSFLQKINAYILLPIYLILIVFAEDVIVLIYGVNYADSALAARLLLLFSIVRTMTDPFYTICYTIEKSNIVLQTMIWGILNLVGNIILVPLLGIEGAALSTGLVSIGIYVHFRIVLKRVENLTLKIPKSLSKVLLNLIPFALLLSIVKYYSIIDLYGLILLVISAFTYLLMGIKNKVFSPNEKRIIEDKLKISLPFI